jgi:hypothetical protein
MDDWTPISDAEFGELLAAQVASLGPGSRERYERYRVAPWRAAIRRPGSSVDESVFVVVRDGELAVFFCDVEDEFGPARLDDSGRIEEYGFVGDLTVALFAFPEGYASMRRPRDSGAQRPVSKA